MYLIKLVFPPRRACLEVHASTAGSGFKMVRKRMHLIYKGGIECTDLHGYQSTAQPAGND